jgi:acyl carrier protein
MNFDNFLSGIIVAIDLPNLKEIDPNLSFCHIPDFDSLATLGVMTFCEIEFNYSIEGQSLWDNQTTPKQLFDMVNK